MNVLYDRAYIEARVAPDLNSGCWLWAHSLNFDGYGRIGVKRDGRAKLIAAHRVSYEAFHGPIPDGLWVLHKCDTPTCVNPRHLFLGDVRDNMSDCSRKGRTRFQRLAQRTHCKRGHEFTPENAAYRGDGQRRCRTCIANGRPAYRARKREGYRIADTRVDPAVDALARSMFHQRWPGRPWDSRTANRTWWRRKAQAALSISQPKEGATP
jgi:hypothetical protein